MTERADMEAVVEAILFVANEPVSRDKLLEVFQEGERDAAQEALDTVVERYRGDTHRGITVDEVAGGLRLVSRPDLHGYLRRFFEVSGTNKLTMAALEALSIIAYRQPVTGPEIQELRGVNSSGVIKKLLERRLVRIAGRKEVVGKPFLYATTREFLMHFGLRSLKELPPLEQFEELLGVEAAEEPSPPDLEEEASLEAAALADAEDEAAEAAEVAEIEAERAAAEEAEEAAELEALSKILEEDGTPEEVPGTSGEEAVDEEPQTEDVQTEDVPGTPPADERGGNDGT